MVPMSVRADRRTLTLRIFSALILAPVAVAAAWFGAPWLQIVTVAAAGGMGWEWARLCREGRLGASGIVLVAAIVAAVIATIFGSIELGLATAVGDAALVLWMARREHDRDSYWLAVGSLWVALPCVIFLWLAQNEAVGRLTLLWIFAVVWATDIGAYAIGRCLGGPRLAPRWSPRKTWAGLIGGIGCAALAGWATARVAGISPALPLVVISAGLAIVEQFGDLAESVAKRRFGVKDSSGLIPGHGGLLDRLDGLLAVIPAVALLTMIGGGSVVTWR
jgi:phosphatidate cytidylyltransferase